MAKSPAGDDQTTTKRCCERISLLTKQQYELVASDQHIVLIGKEGPIGYWQCWQQARASLEPCVKITELAYLDIVLLSDNSAGNSIMKEVKRELTDAREELAIARIELKYLKRAVRHYIAQEKR